MTYTQLWNEAVRVDYSQTSDTLGCNGPVILGLRGGQRAVPDGNCELADFDILQQHFFDSLQEQILLGAWLLKAGKDNRQIQLRIASARTPKGERCSIRKLVELGTKVLQEDVWLQRRRGTKP